MKTDAKSPDLKKNIAYSLSYQFLVLILPLITLPYISRVFGSENIGVYTYSHVFANYFVLFAMLGIANHGSRAIAAVRNDEEALGRTFKELFMAKLFSSAALFILYLLFCRFFVKENSTIFLLQSVYVASALFNINWFCFGMENFRLTTLRDTFVQVASTAAIFAFVRSENDLWIYTLILSAAPLVSALLVWPYALRTVRRVKITKEGILKHLKPLWILFIPILAESIYLMMDKLMLGGFSSNQEVGLYECACRIIVVPGVIIGALNTTVMPRISNLRSAGSEKEETSIRDSIILISTLLGCAMAFGLAAVGGDFAVLFYGNGFERTGLFLVLLSPVVLFKCLSVSVRMQYIVPAGLDNTYMISIITGAAINLILNLILIPRFFGIGAIIGTIAAEFAVMFLQFYLCRKALPLGKYMRDLLIFVVIGLGMYVLVRLIGRIPAGQIVRLIIQVFSGAAFFLLCSLFCLKYKQSKNH